MSCPFSFPRVSRPEALIAPCPARLALRGNEVPRCLARVSHRGRRARRLGLEVSLETTRSRRREGVIAEAGGECAVAGDASAATRGGVVRSRGVSSSGAASASRRTDSRIQMRGRTRPQRGDFQPFRRWFCPLAVRAFPLASTGRRIEGMMCRKTCHARSIANGVAPLARRMHPARDATATVSASLVTSRGCNADSRSETGDGAIVLKR